MDFTEIGELLRKTRESKRYKLKTASDALKIRTRYLEAIESGDIDSIASEVYLNGCIKSYAKWLGLDTEGLLSKDTNPSIVISRPESDNIKPASSMAQVIESGVRPGNTVIIIALVVAIIAYFAWYMINNNEYHHDDVSAMVEDELAQVDDGSSAAGSESDSSSGGEAASAVAPAAEQSVQPISENLVLMAKDNVTIKIFDKDGNLKSEISMKDGDAQVLNKGDLVTISADNPDFIEVYGGENQADFLGNLTTQPFLRKN